MPSCNAFIQWTIMYHNYQQDMRMLLALSLLFVAISASKLVYLAELFRHGARYTVSDIWDGKDTKPFHGQLTSIGMRQQYLLGSYLKKDYLDTLKLISSALNPSQVQAFSDTSERCYQSAYAHLAGLFQLNYGEQIPTNTLPQFLLPPFQLISQPSLKTEQDKVNGQFALYKGYQAVPIKAGGAYFPPCPNQALLIAKRAEVILERALLLEAEQTLFIQKIKTMFNLTLQQDNLYGMIQLYDVLVCDKNLGRPLPSEFTDKQFEELKFIQNYMMILLYDGHLAQVMSTPIAQSIISNMEKVISGQLNDKKLTVYSGHDTNVAPMLAFLNMSNAECVKRKFKNETVPGNCGQPVPFAGNIIFELHQNQNAQSYQASSYFVKVKYNGDYYQLCEKKSTQCNFQQFSRRIKHQLVDYRKQCGSK